MTLLIFLFDFCFFLLQYFDSLLGKLTKVCSLITMRVRIFFLYFCVDVCIGFCLLYCPKSVFFLVCVDVFFPHFFPSEPISILYCLPPQNPFLTPPTIKKVRGVGAFVSVQCGPSSLRLHRYTSLLLGARMWVDTHGPGGAGLRGGLPLSPESLLRLRHVRYIW